MLSVRRVLILCALMLSACGPTSAGRMSITPGGIIPEPAMGLTAAAYTAGFAEAHHLPPENISSDFNAGVAYMDMQVIPIYEGSGPLCVVNMLVKKPHDIAYFPRWEITPWAKAFNAHRKLTLYLTQPAPPEVRELSSFEMATRDATELRKGYRQSTMAYYIPNYIEGYDYFSAILGCGFASLRLLRDGYNVDAFSFVVQRASVWGGDTQKYKYVGLLGNPPAKEYPRLFFHINIPKELIAHIFKEML